MALTEETVNDKIEVINKGDWSSVGVRIATIIKRDGVEISRSFSRKVIAPNADLSSEDADVVAVCNVVFTDAVKAAHLANLAEQE